MYRVNGNGIPAMDMEAPDDDYTEYVPVAKRREIEALKFLKRRQAEAPMVLSRKRKATAALAFEEEDDTVQVKPSLLVKAKARCLLEPEVSPLDQMIRQEKEMIEQASDRKTLMSVHELAKGITYSEPLPTGWKPPLSIRRMSKKECDSIRKCMDIIVEGDDDVTTPPPIKKFKDMRFPDTVLKELIAKGIRKPTPIQVQGLPVILSGRDMIGLAPTGSGKTLAFVLPLIMMALQEELMMPIVQGEGPFGLVVCPNRELAMQTYKLVEQFLTPAARATEDYDHGSNPVKIRALLCTGGIDMRSQSKDLKQGIHIVVATPGRLNDLLGKKMINLDNCRYLTLDEADVLLDDFEDAIREMFDYFKYQRQTLLFSATMSEKTRIFAQRGLVKPVTVNVMVRVGAANVHVIQEVEYVKQEAKIAYLLECLQKTPPPVLVFCENKADVDDIHTYLLQKGIDAVGIHGGMEHQERQYAVSSFKAGKRDVLVATAVASKGLDFPNIQHVINYDMPASIDQYVHRIGRTGRGGNTGIATTFINRNQSETILLDLKHLLQEAKQRIPPVLAQLNDPMEDVNAIPASGVVGCAYCGGLGHRICGCPKLVEHQKSMQMAGSRRDYFSSGGYRGEI